MAHIKPALDAIARQLGSPVPVIVAFVLGGFAASGKFSVTATQIMFLAAWGVGLIGLRSKPPRVIVGVGAVLGFGLILLAYYSRPDAVPQYFGALTRQRRLLFYPEIKTGLPTLQIGNSLTSFTFGGPAGSPLFTFFEDSSLTIETIDGKVKVSTVIRDDHGKIIAELVRNEWRVLPPPNTFDRNYTDDALEVRNAEGDVVLQVKILTTKIQLQGEWRDKTGRGLRLLESPSGQGMFVFSGNKGFQSTDAKIRPMFEYPSESHFGMLKIR